jgi:hypothetical protein
MLVISLALSVPCEVRAQVSGAGGPHVSTAFFYGAKPPRELFAHFDRVVVEADHLDTVPASGTVRAQPFAYVSVGEVNRSRPWHGDLPASLVLGHDDTWGSDIVDTASPAWKAFLLERVVEPLYARGFRGFFLDALDSYRKVQGDSDAAARRVRGTADIVLAIKRAHPDVKVLLNRGFELLPLVGTRVEGLVVESLFCTATPDVGVRVRTLPSVGPADVPSRAPSGTPSGARYGAVSPDESAALLREIESARARYGLPVTVIDYVPPNQPEQRRADALRIWQLGFDPWVTTPSLDSVGVGRVEIMPRKIMLLYVGTEEGFLGVQDAAVLVAPVLEYLGYVVDYVDVRRGLPPGDLSGQYAGVVTLVPEGVPDADAYRGWLLRQIDRGLRIAFLEGFGFGADPAFLARLGLAPASVAAKAPMHIERATPYVGFETPLRARLHDLPPVRVQSSSSLSLLRVTDAAGDGWDAIVLGRWGGAAFQPYVVEDGLEQERRWILDPFRFLRDALALPPMPAPDVTTESGRRILTIHIDGDAFVSRAERRSADYTGQIVLDEVLRKYPLPHTVSIVEGEIGPEGMFPKESPRLEAIARAIFALPNVEIASHTYSHPFDWAEAESGKHSSPPPHLNIPGYSFDLRREIEGSVEYINRRLAPPGKRVKVLLWPGDCEPSATAVAMAQGLGLYDVNGGGSTRTRALPSLTRGTAMGIPRAGGAYQVFAPVENENVYTNEWRGPYYGYARAIETFELNDEPRRLGILSLYYHFYSAAKTASMAALERVYAYAMKQETTPLYLSEYAAKVLAFQRMSLARRLDDGGWEIADAGELRTLRVDPAWGWPDMSRSRGVAGVRDTPQGRYVTLAKNGDGDPLLFSAPEAPESVRLESANGRVLHWEPLHSAPLSGERAEPRGDARIEVRIKGNVPLVVAIAGAARSCTLRTVQGTLTGVRAGLTVRFSLPQTDTGEATLECH